MRFGRYLHSLGFFNGQMEDAVRSEARRQAIACLNEAHAVGGPAARHLFTDVYDETPWIQREQQADLKAQIEAYPEHYKSYLSEAQLEGL